MPPALSFGHGATNRLSDTDFYKMAFLDADFLIQIFLTLAYNVPSTNQYHINRSNRRDRLLIFIMCLSVGISLGCYLH